MASKRRAIAAVASADLAGDDFKNFGLAVGAVQRALTEAISMLKTKANRAADPDEGNRIAEQAGEFQEKLQAINRELSAFLAGTGQVVAPSATDVEKLQGMANDLDEMIATQQSAQVIIKAATDVIKLWDNTHPK